MPTADLTLPDNNETRPLAPAWAPQLPLNFLKLTARGLGSHLAKLKLAVLLNLGSQLDRGRLQGTSLWLLSPGELHLSSLLELIVPFHLQPMAAR